MGRTAVGAWFITGLLPLVFFVVGSNGIFDGEQTTVAVAVVTILATLIMTINAIVFSFAWLWQVTTRQA